MPSPSGETRSYWIDLVLLASLLGLFWGRFLFGDAVLYSGDTFYYFYPLRHTLFTALQSGYFPDWESVALSGNPFCANPQANCYYPLSLWFRRPDFFSAYQWSVVSHLLIGAAGVYLWLQGRRHTRLAALLAAIAFAMGGPTLSMVNRLDKLESLAWWPWAMFGLERLLRRQTGGLLLLSLALALQLLAGGLEVWVMAVGALVLWGILVPATRASTQPSEPDGDIQVPDPGSIPVVTPSAAPMFSRGTAIAHASPQPVRATPVATVSFLAVALLLCGLVTAPQWVTFLELLEHSSRSSGMSYEKAVALSLRPADLLGALIPHLFYNPASEGFHPTPISPAESRYFLGLYLGWLPLLAAFWAVPAAIRRDPDGAAARCAIVLAGLGLLLATGAHNPVYRPLFEALPPLRTIRYPEKFLSLTAFFALPLLALGLERWQTRTRGFFVVVWLGATLSLALFLVPGPLLRLGALLVSLSAGGPPETWWEKLLTLHSHLELQALVLMAAGGAGLLWARGILRERLAVPLLVMLVGVDLWSAGWALNPPMEAATLRTPARFAAQLGPLGPLPRVHVLWLYGETPAPPAPGATPIEAYRWLWESLYPNTGQLSGFAYADGARAVRLDLSTRFFAGLRGAPLDQQLRLAAIAGIDAIVATPEQRIALEQSQVAAPLQVLPESGLSLWKLSASAQDGYVVRDAVTFSTPQQALQALQRGLYPPTVVGLVSSGEGMDRAATHPASSLGATADSHPRDGGGEAIMTGPAATLRRRTSRGGAYRELELAATTEPAYLVLPEAWYPGWSARVDGQPAPVLQANGYQMAVALPAGARRVELEFVPRHRNLALWASALGLVLLAVSWIAERRWWVGRR